jgi:hypothetical protein
MVWAATGSQPQHRMIFFVNIASINNSKIIFIAASLNLDWNYLCRTRQLPGTAGGMRAA